MEYKRGKCGKTKKIFSVSKENITANWIIMLFKCNDFTGLPYGMFSLCALCLHRKWISVCVSVGAPS